MDPQYTPPTISAPAQYSSVLPTAAAPAGVVTLAPGASVNFSGLQQGSTPSNFTLAGWVRANTAFLASQLPDSGDTYPLFTNGQVTVAWSGSGLLVGGFGPTSSGTWVDSSVSFADGTWHFVALSFAQAGDVGGGVLSLFVDGTVVASASFDASTMPVTAAGTMSLCAPATLGAGQQMDLAAWLVWSLAVPASALAVPVWGAPPSGPLSDGLMAAFDFANGAVVDQSGAGATIVVGAQQLNTPCLQLTGSSTVLIPQADGLNPGSSGDFSIMGWVCPTPAATKPIYLLVNEFVDGTTFQFGIVEEANAPTEYQFLIEDLNNPSGGFEFSSNHFDLAGAWVHVALTYSSASNRFWFYANGVLVNDWSPSDNGGGAWQTNAGSARMTIQGAEQATSLQGLSYWSNALSQAQIAAIVARVDPTGTPNCTASFSLSLPSPQGFMDSVDGVGASLTVTAGSGALGELTSPVTPAAAAALAARSQAFTAVTPPAVSARLMTVSDYFTLARANGIDPDAPPSEEISSSAAFTASVAWYEGLLQDVPAGLASCLRDQFKQRLSLGVRLRQKVPHVGRFTRDRSVQDGALMYGAASGLVPVFEDEGDPFALDPTRLTQLCINVAMDIFGLALSLVGLQTLAKSLGRVINKIGTTTVKGVAQAAAGAFKEASSDAANAANALIEFLEKLSDCGSIGTFCWNALYGMSWWEILFAVVSFAAQIAGIVVSGGALLAIKLVNLALGIIGLISDLVELVDYLKDGGASSEQLEQAVAT